METVPGTNIPKPRVKLIGGDGNAFFVIGKVQRALRKASVPKEVIDKFVRIATSGDYNDVLSTAMDYADVE